MKSIYFNQVPALNGKLTMRFTDVVVENFKPKIHKKLAEKQMKTLCEDTDNIDYPDHPSEYDSFCSWDCDICDWQNYIGKYRPHTHYID